MPEWSKDGSQCRNAAGLDQIPELYQAMAQGCPMTIIVMPHTNALSKDR